MIMAEGVNKTKTKPIMVMAAPNGARLQKSHAPNLPISSFEIANCASRLSEIGVSVLHLHVRDENGNHTLDPYIYQNTIEAIRNKVGTDLIIQITTESVGLYDRYQQMQLVREIKPEAVSLALREICPNEDALLEAGEFFREITAQGIWPQYILYSIEDLRRFEKLRLSGFFGLKAPFALIVFGRFSNSGPSPSSELDDIANKIDLSAFPWAVCAFGRSEYGAALKAYEMGGHIRLGFENNQFLPNGDTASSNFHLIKETLVSIEKSTASRHIATAQEIRKSML